MTATQLFAKAKAAPAVFAVHRVTDEQRLTEWLQRGRSERFVVETQVTPKMAQLLLDRNIENRPLNLPAVEAYAAAMRRGEWLLNGQNIIVADTGEVNDGQHRLSAILSADMPVQMGLHFGVSRESRTTLDVGRKRTLADHFSMAGQTNAILLAAAVRLAWQYDNGIYSLASTPTVEQAFTYLRKNPQIGEYLHIGSRIGTAFSTSGAQFAFAGYVCGRVNAAVSRELLERTLDGLGLTSAGVPAARLRERLLQHVVGKPPLGRYEPAAVLIKAFNAARAGRRLRSLSWAPTGPKGEAFPIAGE